MKQIQSYYQFAMFVFWSMIASITIHPNLYAQDKIPPGLNYQALARDENGYPIAEKEIVVKIAIISGTENGPLEWEEVHRVTTEESGFFSLVIGEGVPTYNGKKTNFEIIDWGATDYYMKVSVDFGASEYGNAMLDMGIAKLQSVPYAFMSRHSFRADIADSALNMPKLPTFSQLLKVTESSLKADDVVQWDGTKWIVAKVKVDVPIPEDFIRRDGTTDLTNNWNINTYGITLQNGTMKAKSLISNSLMLTGTTMVSGISNDIGLGGSLSSDNVLSTQKAIKQYIDLKSSDTYWKLNGNYLYAASESVDRRIGIGTATPLDRFHAYVAGYGFVVTGDFDGGATSIRASGPGTRMAFYPSKGAFRAGGLQDGGSAANYWDHQNVGNYSVAMGRDNLATGNYSAVFGLNNQAVNSQAFSAGTENMSSGTSSTTFGKKNVAQGGNTFAIGTSTQAIGENCVSMGLETQSRATNSMTVGYKTLSFGMNSLAIGANTTTFNQAEASIAAGGSTQTHGKYSSSFGYKTKANSYAEFVIGQYNSNYEPVTDGNIEWKRLDRVFIIGIGNGLLGDPQEKADALVVYKNGKIVIPGAVECGTLTQTSDARYKRNIVPINNALDKVLAMNGIYYEWENNIPGKILPAGRQLGFVAQDIESIVPEIVVTDNMGYKSLDYSKTTALLVEAIKTQQKQIDELKSENDQLKTKNIENEQLKKQLEELQLKVDKLFQSLNNQ